MPARKNGARNGAPLPSRGRKQTISLALINLQVQLKPIQNPRKPVSGNYICPTHEEKVSLKKCCATCDGPIDDAVIAYQAENGAFVVVPDDEIDAITAGKSGILNINRVVDAAAVDPAYKDKSYFVYEDGTASVQAFDLVREALAQMGKAAVGTVVLGKQTQMVALRYSQEFGCMIAETLVFDAWIRWDEVNLVSAAAASRPAPQQQQIDLAVGVLSALDNAFDPEEVEDEFYPALAQLVEAHSQGKKPAIAPPPSAAPVLDLNAALQASLQQAAAGKTKAAAKPKSRKKVAA